MSLQICMLGACDVAEHLNVHVTCVWAKDEHMSVHVGGCGLNVGWDA